MSGLGAMLDTAAPGIARTLRLLRRIKSPRTRKIFLRREFDRRFLRHRQRLPLLRRNDQILFVCHGNIMRSALAEVALRNALGAGMLSVASAGTAATPGAPADPRAVAYATQAGLDLGAHRARRFDADFAAGSALIFALDRRIEAEILAVEQSLAARTFLLAGISAPDPYAGRDVDDPYTLAEAPVTTSFELVLRSVATLADWVKRSKTGAQ